MDTLIEHITHNELQLLNNAHISWFPSDDDKRDIFIENEDEYLEALTVIGRREKIKL